MSTGAKWQASGYMILASDTQKSKGAYQSTWLCSYVFDERAVNKVRAIEYFQRVSTEVIMEEVNLQATD